MMESNGLLATVLRHKITIALGVILVVFLNVLLGNGFLGVSFVSAKSGAEISYNLTKTGQAMGKDVKTKSSSFSKYVSKGDYMVFASQGDSSGFGVSKTKGMFQKTNLSIALKPEIRRTYVGNGPSGCMNYVQERLISYDCQGTLSTGKIHMPSTPTQATFTKKANAPSGQKSSILSIVGTADGDIAVVQYEQPDGTNKIQAGRIDKDFALTDQVDIAGLDPKKGGVASPFNGGYIIYDKSITKVLYFSSLHAAAKAIAIDKPKDTSLRPSIINASTGSNKLTIVFTNSVSDDPGKEGGVVPATGSKAKAKSEVLVYDFVSGNTKTINFDNIYSYVVACGTNKLCVQDSNQVLSVYSVDKTKKPLYSLSDIKRVEVASGGLLLLHSGDMAFFDADKQSGYSQYGFGEYKFCGIQVDQKGYILCIKDGAGNNVALRMDDSKPNTNSIDKLVSRLRGFPEVKGLSVYGSIVSVVVDHGDLVFDTGLHSFTYDRATTKKNSDAVDAKIKKLGIDTSNLTINYQ